MLTLEDPGGLVSEPRTFEKVGYNPGALHDPAATAAEQAAARGAIDKGTLVVGDEHLEFAGKKSSFRIERIRAVSRLQLAVRVEYGEGPPGGSAVFGRTSPRFRDELFAAMQGMIRPGAMPAEEIAQAEATNQKHMQRLRSEGETRERRGKASMWIGGLGVAFGLVLSLVSEGRAVAWGTIVIGALILVRGFAVSREGRRLAAGVELRPMSSRQLRILITVVAIVFLAVIGLVIAANYLG